MDSVTAGPERILQRVRDTMASTEAGHQRDTIERHYRNLTGLAQSLRKLGLDDQAVGGALTDVFEQYEHQLNQFTLSVEDATRSAS